MLCHGADFFLNGELVVAPRALHSQLLRLADERRLPAGARLGRQLVAVLHGFYRHGFVEPGS
jgi:hypothetical protein